jgi:hypothetical protein
MESCPKHMLLPRSWLIFAFLKTSVIVQSTSKFPPSVRPPAHTHNRWTNFHDIWYQKTVQNVVKPFTFLFESDSYNYNSTWPACVFESTSLNIYRRQKCLEWKLLVKLKHPLYVQYTFSTRLRMDVMRSFPNLLVEQSTMDSYTQLQSRKAEFKEGLY